MLARVARAALTVRVAWALAVIVLLLPVKDLVRLHPYQVTYYNELVGGVGGASEDYWTDYYLSSYVEAIQWVNERAAATPDERIEVWIAAGPGAMPWIEDYGAPNVELIATTGLSSWPPTLPVDYYIVNSRYGSGERYPDAPIVHSIGRDGAVFTVVRGRAEGAPSGSH